MALYVIVVIIPVVLLMIKFTYVVIQMPIIKTKFGIFRILYIYGMKI